METAPDSMVMLEDSEAGGITPFKDRASPGKEKSSPKESVRKKEKREKEKKKKSKHNE